MHFRVVIDHTDNKTIRSCEAVEGSKENGDHVYYVQANSKAEAIKQARYIHRRAMMAAGDVRRRAKLKDAGMCTRGGCRQPAEPGKIRCMRCQKQQRAWDNQRRLRRKAGIPPRTRASERTAEEAAAIYDKMESARQASIAKNPMCNRRAFLIEMCEVYDRIGPGPSPFRVWLDQELERTGLPRGAWLERARTRAEQAASAAEE